MTNWVKLIYGISHNSPTENGGGVGEMETFGGSHYFRGNGGVSIVVCVGVKITQPYPKGLSSIKILN